MSKKKTREELLAEYEALAREKEQAMLNLHKTQTKLNKLTGK